MAKEDSIDRALWAIWHRLGLPQYQQVDNEMAFYGYPTHPGEWEFDSDVIALRGGAHLFPVKKPWCNGGVDKFNHRWRQKCLGREELKSAEALLKGSLNFEALRNAGY